MSNLYGHVLNGKIVGVEINNYAVIKVPFVIGEVAPLGYADISTIENWWNFGEGLEDYLYLRREIKNIVVDKGIANCISTLSDPPISPADGDNYYVDPNGTATGIWEGYEGWCATWDNTNSIWVKEPPEWLGYRVCSNAEKNICAKLKIGSQGDHFADYGVPAIVDYGLEYHREARATREARMLRAVVEVYNIIPLNVAESLGDITASPLGDMYFRYMEFGVKGTVEDFNKDFNPNPTPGIIDWIQSRAPFNNQEPFISAGYPSGLTQKTWTPIDGSTLQQFSDKLYNVLVNGTIVSL